MDFLDSILSGMDKPPAPKKPVIKDEEKRKQFEKLQRDRQRALQKQKAALQHFREYIAKKIKNFVELHIDEVNEATRKLQLKPMTKIQRSIVYETCEDYANEIVVHSFGTEELDRHCVIYKCGFEPSDDELHSLKLGVEYKPKRPLNEEDESDDDSNNKPNETEGKDRCREKYEKIIGENSHGIQSATISMPAKQYGCVPIDLKKDQRTVEEVMNEIRKNKKAKLNDEPGTSEEPKKEETDEQ